MSQSKDDKNSMDDLDALIEELNPIQEKEKNNEKSISDLAKELRKIEETAEKSLEQKEGLKKIPKSKRDPEDHSLYDDQVKTLEQQQNMALQMEIDNLLDDINKIWGPSKQDKKHQVINIDDEFATIQGKSIPVVSPPKVNETKGIDLDKAREILEEKIEQIKNKLKKLENPQIEPKVETQKTEVKSPSQASTAGEASREKKTAPRLGSHRNSDSKDTIKRSETQYSSQTENSSKKSDKETASFNAKHAAVNGLNKIKHAITHNETFKSLKAYLEKNRADEHKSDDKNHRPK